MALKDEIREYIMKDFGEFSAAKVDLFAKQINPEKNPKEFIEKCTDFLSTMLGEKLAREKLNEFYKKYT